ncbi:MAG: DUF4406 domain-containing protein [Roseburia sp.]|nr:DUF4406 domain-containing protein [Roseburia sp.]
MGFSKYNSEQYLDLTAYGALTQIEKEERTAAKAAAFRPIVYICSPYAGGAEKNMERARKYSRFAVDSHYLPITPHIYFTQFMDDNIPQECETAMFMNRVLMSKCCELWVFGGIISEGMKAEIEYARRKNMKIRYFTEECQEV